MVRYRWKKEDKDIDKWERVKVRLIPLLTIY
jgi:hypothetical protein